MGRLRSNTQAPQLIKEFPNYVDLKYFKVINQPIYLEVGCGKGSFLIENAINNPKIFFLGIEKYSTVILKAFKKINNLNCELKNLLFTCIDVAQIDQNLLKHKISKLFLNFSDPWPKKRHEKRRLTSSNFLNIYKNILKKHAFVEFKTDNHDFYLYTLAILKSRSDVRIHYFTNNLYSEAQNPYNFNNILTEYEKKFIGQGKTIKKIVWEFK